jgi:hypothetical protein
LPMVRFFRLRLYTGPVGGRGTPCLRLINWVVINCGIGIKLGREILNINDIRSIGSRIIAWDCCFRLCLRQVKNCPFAIRSVAQWICFVLRQIKINKQLRTKLTPEKLRVKTNTQSQKRRTKANEKWIS